MLSALALILSARQDTAADPLLLAIGRSGRLKVQTGQMVDLANGRAVTPQDVAKAARNTRYVYLGEEHGNLEHHQMQAAIIRALAADGRHVVVGMEQFTRPVQENLAAWTLGWYTDEQFIAKSDWSGVVLEGRSAVLEFVSAPSKSAKKGCFRNRCCIW